MRVISKYVCEFCNTQYDTEAEARACEASGYPEPMPWLPIGERVPAFGESGVKWTTITRVSLAAGRFGGHVWEVLVSEPVFLNHNRPDDWPYWASDFDPREGTDAFRYAGSPEDITTWTETMKRYGFAEDQASSFVLSNVNHWRALHAKKGT